MSNAENAARAKRAEVALVAYIQTIGHDEPSDGLVDLLTDLQHWCRIYSKTFGFDEALERADSHYSVEIREEQE